MLKMKTLAEEIFFYAVINQDNDTVRLAENNYRELLIGLSTRHFKNYLWQILI